MQCCSHTKGKCAHPQTEHESFLKLEPNCIWNCVGAVGCFLWKKNNCKRCLCIL